MRFDIKAVRDDVGVAALTFDAANEADARSQAKAQGYDVLAIKSRQLGLRRGSGGNARFPLALFSQELLTLLDAGLTLVESMETLAEKEQRPETKQVLKQVIAQLYEGRPISYGLQQFPAQFPPLYVSTVKASEKTGDLSEALSRYVAYEARLDVVRKKVKSAAIYPVLLLGAGGLVTLFLLGYVVPRFSRIYEDLGSDLPFLSKVLLEWGKLLEQHGWLMLAALLIVGGAVAYLFTRPQTREWIAQKMWGLPTIGERMRVYQLARLYRTVGMLLRGGTPIVQALDMVPGLLQPALRPNLRLAAQDVREGKPLSQAMAAHGLTTPVSVRMLGVGERTGQMGEMMDRVAGFYDDDMARWVDWFTKLFEPILMAVIGLVIGAIVVLMYLPIFELAGSLQ
jgi:general secretion pathway protein F